jgi:hypothetical protein
MKKLTSLLTVALLATAVGTAQAGPWFAKGDYFAGVNGNWNSDAGNEMFDDGTNGDAVSADGIFTRDVTTDMGVGRHEWKAALDDWSSAFPGTNQWVYIFAPSDVITMTLDTNFYADEWIPNQNIVWNSQPMPVGSTLEVIGGAAEIGSWGSGVAASLIGSVWTLQVNVATPGFYEYKWRANGNWDDFVFGLDGAASAGGNLGFETTEEGESVRFELNVDTGRARVVYEDTVAVDPSTWSQIKSNYR